MQRWAGPPRRRTRLAIGEPQMVRKQTLSRRPNVFPQPLSELVFADLTGGQGKHSNDRISFVEI